MLTVTAPATTRDLATLAAVKAELEMALDSQHDGYLNGLITQMSRAIESWCGRSLVREGVRETIHLTAPAEALVLTRFPVSEIVSVTTEANTLAPSLYEADAGPGTLYRLTTSGARSIWSPGRVLVDYTAGFLPAGEARDLPPDIERAAILAVRNAFLTRGRDQTVRSDDVEGIGSFSYGMTSALPADVTELLAPYRLPGFA
ncbi:phage head-tail connector protein [Ancylobacter rudongensis]|uniref:Phage gp6-like head-tail connector protein n=1 Tax=Ancylobacter rudongensis TaxID=177413 RepID=A0A1G4PPB0_9HYPH|nr:phage head-tail connector protein [Ancylobacter rudongensis]SCW34107.1 phage conserved hypothetical protein, phiE125 gp8 family [Ancylobacter rudongensis]